MVGLRIRERIGLLQRVRVFGWNPRIKEVRVSIRESLDTAFLCWLSKPQHERPLYRLVKKHRIDTIVELGVRDLARSLRLIRLARRCVPDGVVRYTGIDLFEARPADRPRLTLKQAHRALAHSGATVRLIPGDGPGVLSRHANQLTGTQLLVVSVVCEPQELGRAWYYIPRMLAPPSLVLLQHISDAANPRGLATVPTDQMHRWGQAVRQPDRTAA